MDKNRIKGFLRDPTLDQPQTDFYRVRVPWESFLVNKENAARVLAAASSSGPPRLVRIETVTGSVTYVRSDTVVFVTESTKAQREAERRLWKELDDEEDGTDLPGS